MLSAYFGVTLHRSFQIVSSLPGGTTTRPLQSFARKNPLCLPSPFGTICKMEQRELQLGILSAQNLKNVNMSGKITPYAVAWDFPNIKVSTTIDPTGSVNTTWNPLCILTVQKWILEQQNANVQIDISRRGIISNKHVGSCSVPLSNFQEMDSEGADTEKVISLPVHTPSGRPHGMLHLSLKLGDVYQPSAMPGPSSAVAHTVEPNNNNPILAYSAHTVEPNNNNSILASSAHTVEQDNNNPILAYSAHTVERNNNNPIPAYFAGYPNGSNQVGGSQYLQYHPQHPQSDRLVTGPQYSPVAFQYAFRPLPQDPQYAFPTLAQDSQYAFPALSQYPQSYPVYYAAPPRPERTGLSVGGIVKTVVSVVQGAAVVGEFVNIVAGGGCGAG